MLNPPTVWYCLPCSSFTWGLIIIYHFSAKDSIFKLMFQLLYIIYIIFLFTLSSYSISPLHSCHTVVTMWRMRVQCRGFESCRALPFVFAFVYVIDFVYVYVYVYVFVFARSRPRSRASAGAIPAAFPVINSPCLGWKVEVSGGQFIKPSIEVFSLKNNSMWSLLYDLHRLPLF